MTPHETKLRVAVIGCGYWGKNLVRNFHELGALAAVHDEDRAAALQMHRSYDVEVRDLADILGDPSIQGVVIAAPAGQHFTLSRQALLAGKDVFVEKPLALDVRDARELCELAEREERILMVGHLLRYHPAYMRLKQIVREGTLGRIQYIYSTRLNLGKFRREENILWSFAPHDISMILDLIDDDPDQVTAIGQNYLHKSIADTTTTHLSFPGGEGAHIFVSWLHPFKEQKLVVVGSNGMAVFDDNEPWPSKLALYAHQIEWRDRIPHPVKAEIETITVEEAEPLRNECAHFLDCIGSRATPVTNGREGLRVLNVLQLAERSMISDESHGGDLTGSSRTDISVHESAYVDDSVEIGPGTRIWHFSHILSGTQIGRHCTIGQNVMIGPDVIVGNNCKIQNNVSLYKGVVLEDGVFCGPSCVFTNVSTPRAEIDRRAEFRKTLVKRGATIGANATIVCGNTIGSYSFIAAGAVVTHDVPAHAMVVGVPARQIGWVSHAGERLTEDLTCPRTARRYRETPDGLEEVDEGTDGSTA